MKQSENDLNQAFEPLHNDFKYSFASLVAPASSAVNPALFLSSIGTNFSFTINLTVSKLSDLAAA